MPPENINYITCKNCNITHFISIFQAITNSSTLINPLNNSYLKQFQIIARYLIMLAKLKGISKGEFYRLKKEALNYSI